MGCNVKLLFWRQIHWKRQLSLRSNKFAGMQNNINASAPASPVPFTFSHKSFATDHHSGLQKVMKTFKQKNAVRQNSSRPKFGPLDYWSSQQQFIMSLGRWDGINFNPWFMYFPNTARFSDIGPTHFCCNFPLLSHHTLININAFFLVTLIFCCSNTNVMKQCWCGVTPEASHIVK